MTDTRHSLGVLLVPEEGDPRRLLVAGTGRGLPPRAWRGDGMWFDWNDPDNPDPDDLLLDGTEAIVLAYGGDVNEEGCAWVDPDDSEGAYSAVHLFLCSDQGHGEREELRAWFASLGDLVFVDLAGWEVD